MENYEKILLYVYPKFGAVISTLDGKFKSIIASSRYALEPAETSLNNLIEVGDLIRILKTTKDVVKKALLTLDEVERDFVEFKYFKLTYDGLLDFNTQSYDYRRLDIKVIKKFKKYLERFGITEKWFDDNLMRFSFIREVARRTQKIEKEFFTNVSNIVS